MFPTAYLPYLDGLIGLAVMAVITGVWWLFKGRPKN